MNFPVAVLEFLTELAANNNREWFAANKKTFELAQKENLTYVAALLDELKKEDTSLADLEPKKCVFRIYRDTRFSPDKSPYKTNMGAYFNAGGKNAMTAGYYFHVSPGDSMLAGGMWMPPNDVLAKIREEIDYNLSSFEAIVKAPAFTKALGELEGEKLTRPPKGYTPDNQAVEYLKHKSFVFTKKITDQELLASTPASVAKALLAGKPLIDFLNSAVAVGE